MCHKLWYGDQNETTVHFLSKIMVQFIIDSGKHTSHIFFYFQFVVKSYSEKTFSYSPYHKFRSI